jgi:hypothetical protein
MEQSIRTLKTSPDPIISLERIVNNLVQHSFEAAHAHNTHVFNHVKGGVTLGTSSHKAIPVMRDLLTTVVNNSNNGDIHITAERYRDTVILEIQERNNNNGYALAYSIGSLEPDAASLGGYISVRDPRQKIITISFTFPKEGMTA